MGRESVAAVINGEEVSLSAWLRSMQVTGDPSPFERCAGQRLIAQLARREGLEVSRRDLQAGVDAWRCQNRLERVEDTEAWLSRRGLALEDVAAEVQGRLLKDALAQKVTEGQIEPYFAQHILEFEEAEIRWIFVVETGIAEEIRAQVAEERADFFCLARRYSEDGATRPCGGYLGRLRRDQLPKGIAPLAFAAKPGEVVGPVRIPGGYALYLIQQVYPAALNEASRKEIRDRLFSAWLAREVQQARIEFPLASCLRR